MRVILFLWANIFLSIFNIHLYITQILCVISNTTKGKNMKCIKSLFSFLYRDPEVHLRLIRRGKTSLLEWMRLPNPSKLTSPTALPNYRSRRSLSGLYKQWKFRRQPNPWTSYLDSWEKLNETGQCYFLPINSQNRLGF